MCGTMRKPGFSVAVLLLASALPLAGFSPPVVAGECELAVLADILGTPDAADRWFDAAFLAAVPPAQLRAVLHQMLDAYGAPQSITASGDGYAVTTATHVIPTTITLDGDGKVSGLLFQPAQPLTASLEATLDRLASLPGRVSWLVETDGVEVRAREPDAPLAVGSAFKLAVLAVLKDDIAAGRHAWDEVVHLGDADRSLPSGDLRRFPVGAPLTLHTLATLMIAESDNTATDTLIRVLGRDRVARKLGVEALLTTRNLFQLKADPALGARYAAATAEEKRSILDGLERRALPDLIAASGTYVAGVEWVVPARQLCALINAVADLDVFAVNPGPTTLAKWRRVAYKGGSETGVLNLTAALAGTDGHRHCLSVTVNADAAVDETAVIGLYRRLTDQLAGN
jgi:beta-lactamase class A